VRWLKTIAATFREQTPYDAAIHTRNQLQHGFWMLQLQPAQIIKGQCRRLDPLRKNTAGGRLMLCKAFLATVAVCLDSATRRCEWPLGFCFAKSCPVWARN